MLATQSIVSALMGVAKLENVPALSSLTVILCALTNIPEKRSFLLELNLVPTLGLLRTKTGLDEVVAAAFCQLSSVRESHQQLLKHDALQLLVTYARLTSSSIRADCAQVCRVHGAAAKSYCMMIVKCWGFVLVCVCAHSLGALQLFVCKWA